jgi:hypothetical protein
MTLRASRFNSISMSVASCFRNLEDPTFDLADLGRLDQSIRLHEKPGGKVNPIAYG